MTESTRCPACGNEVHRGDGRGRTLWLDRTWHSACVPRDGMRADLRRGYELIGFAKERRDD